MIDFDMAAVLDAVTQGPALGDVLSGESLAPLLARPDFVAALQPFLPAGEAADADALRANLRSPQFAQALRLFDAALREGAADAVASQLGLDRAAVAQVGCKVAQWLTGSCHTHTHTHTHTHSRRAAAGSAGCCTRSSCRCGQSGLRKSRGLTSSVLFPGRRGPERAVIVVPFSK
jgi:hypothetical protein